MTAHARVFHRSAEIQSLRGPTALTIGNFDGVHLGHQALLARVVEAAQRRGWQPTALTFHPHPTRIVAPHRAPRLLNTLEERIALLQEAGMEQVVVLEFTEALSQLSPEAFARRVLMEFLEARLVVVGANFRFGFRQAGNVDTLQKLGNQLGFVTESVAPISVRGMTVSSSAVRLLIETGQLTRACRLLGRPYQLAGAVIAGRGVGSRQTVPTLNLQTHSEVLPARGVYVTETLERNGPRRWASVTNVGYRPTFSDQSELSVETFLIQPLEGPAPHSIQVRFLRRLRDERKFPAAEALRAQILQDVARAQAYHRRCGRWLRPRVPNTQPVES